MPNKGANTKPRMKFRRINGVEHKRCTGCKRWKPVKEFYTRKSPRVNARSDDRLPRPQCKQCDCLGSGERHNPGLEVYGLVPVANIRKFLDECVTRIGSSEVSRRTGITEQNIWHYRYNGRRRMNRRTAGKILRLTLQLRQTGEARTRAEIHYGTHLRRKSHG